MVWSAPSSDESEVQAIIGGEIECSEGDDDDAISDAIVIADRNHCIPLRQSRELPVERLGMSLNELLRDQPVAWHGVKLASPDLSHDSHVVAATVSGPGNRFRVHFIINAYWKELAFEVPPGGNVFEPWRRCIDTSLDPPDDINGWRESGEIGGETYLVGPRSVVMLFAQSRRAGTK